MRARRLAASAPMRTAMPAKMATEAAERTATDSWPSIPATVSTTSLTRITDTLGKALATAREKAGSSSAGMEMVAMKLWGASSSVPGAKMTTKLNPIVSQLISRNERSEEHTSELQSLMRISSAVFCLKKKNANIY